MVSEFDLICADGWMVHLSNMGFFLGWTAGSVIFSCLAQQYGEPALLALKPMLTSLASLAL